MGGEVDTNGLGTAVIDGDLHRRAAKHCATGSPPSIRTRSTG